MILLLERMERSRSDLVALDPFGFGKYAHSFHKACAMVAVVHRLVGMAGIGSARSYKQHD